MTLLSRVKNYLDITWDEDDTNKKLEGIILRGQHKINELVGAELDFEEFNQAQALLFDYCLYATSGCLNDFYINYKKELLALQINMGVAKDET